MTQVLLLIADDIVLMLIINIRLSVDDLRNNIYFIFNSIVTHIRAHIAIG